LQVESLMVGFIPSDLYPNPNLAITTYIIKSFSYTYTVEY